MSPTKTGTGPNASYRLDRVVPGVGRIRTAIGSARRRDLTSANALVTKLAERGMLDILRQLKEGDITVPELRDADREGTLANVGGGILARRPLLAAARTAIDAMPCRAVTRDYYRRGIEALERHAKLTGVTATTPVKALETLKWPQIAAAWPAGPSDWMRVRRSISAVLSALFSKYDPFRLGVMRLLPRKTEHQRVPTLTPATFREAVAQVPEPIQPILWAIVGMGLRGRELWRLTLADLRPEVHGVVLASGKNDAAGGLVELDPVIYGYLADAIPAARHFRPERVLDAWHAACEAVGAPHTTLHDLRHCFGQWTLDAGLSDADVQVALRHKTAHMTRLYRKRAQQRTSSGVMAGVLGVPQSTPQLRLVVGGKAIEEPTT